MCTPAPVEGWICVQCDKLCEATDIGMDFGLRPDGITPYRRGYCRACWKAIQPPLFSAVAFTPQGSED